MKKKIAVSLISTSLVVAMVAGFALPANAQETNIASSVALQNALSESKEQDAAASDSIAQEVSGAQSDSDSIAESLAPSLPSSVSGESSSAVESEVEGEETEQTPSVLASTGSGTFGTVTWVLDGEGTLTFTSGGTFGGSGNVAANIPWNSYADDIKKIVFTTDVTANAISSFLFYGLTNLVSIEGLTYLNTANVTTMRNMFCNNSTLTTLDLTKFDTKNVTNMNLMFKNCRGLSTLDVTKFDTANVTAMSRMFDGCSGLSSLDVTNFNTSKVETMSFMFDGCSGLSSLDVTNFDTSEVMGLGMTSMFENCSNLTTLDVRNFNTSKNQDTSSMFKNCSSLTTLDVSNFDTTNLLDTTWMFAGCSSLTTLDLSSWNTVALLNMHSMFSRCSSLTTLDVSGLNTSKVWTDQMDGAFAGCSSLKSLTVGTNFKFLPDSYLVDYPAKFAKEWKQTGGSNSFADSLTFTNDYDGATQAGTYVRSSIYTITYSLDSGTNPTTNPATYVEGTGVPTLADASKTGYTFDGWYSDAAFTTKVTAISATQTGNITLYAHFTKNPVVSNITYSLDGGTNPTTNPATYVEGTGVLTLADASKAGYTFGGWYSDAAFTTKVTAISTTQTGNITLYAQFTKNPIVSNIDYFLNGGTNDSTNPGIYTEGVGLATLAAPSKAGHTFDGWFEDANFTIPITKIDTTRTGVISLHAKFTPISSSSSSSTSSSAAASTSTAGTTAAASTASTSAPKTGDTTNIVPLVSVLGVSTLALAAVMIVLVKKKKADQ